MNKMQKNPLTVVLLVMMLFVLLAGGMSFLGLQTVSYTTAYEGAKAQYYGVYDAVTGLQYDSATKHSASMARFDTSLMFDKDEWDKEYCNLEGELTAIQIPLGESNWVPPAWVPQEWWRDAVGWKNPFNSYEWSIKDGEYTDFFRMEEWKTKWFISIEAGWDSQDMYGVWDEADGPRYKGIEVWFGIDISPVWYFENQTASYFAIAKIELSNIKLQGYNTAIIDVIPESVGSIRTVYLNPFGAENAPTETELESFYYQKIKLNPEYFRDMVYTHIDLMDFGTTEYGQWPWMSCQGDVVTMGFTVTQFVVGEWKVKDIGDIPEDYERSSKITVGAWEGFWGGVVAWFTNPWTLFSLFGLGLIILVVLLIVFAPGLLTVVAVALLGRRKGGGKG